MARAMQNTRLRVGGLVNFPVSVYKATESLDVKLERRAPSGAAVSRRDFDSETEKMLTEAEITYGVEIDGQFVPVPTEGLQRITDTIKQRDALDVIEFVKIKEAVAPERVQGAYYLGVPSAKNHGDPRALKILHEAMRLEKVAAVVKWVARSRESLCLVYPWDNTLLMVKMSYATDWREPDSSCTRFTQGTATRAHVKTMRELIGLHTGDGSSIDTSIDEVIPMKKRLIAQAAKGEKVVVSEPATPPVGEFLDQLEKLVKQG